MPPDNFDGVVLRSQLSRRGLARFWLACGVALAVLIAFWFTWSLRDPNYRWIFVPDDIMRVRNILFVLFAAVLVATSIDLYRIAMGSKPLARFSRGASGELIVLQPGAVLGSARKRRTVLLGPVKATWRESPGTPILGGAYPRNLCLSGETGRVRLSTLWAWREDDVEAVRELLGAEAE